METSSEVDFDQTYVSLFSQPLTLQECIEDQVLLDHFVHLRFFDGNSLKAARKSFHSQSKPYYGKKQSKFSTFF